MSKKVLHVDSSARYDSSFSRKFSKQVVESLGSSKVTYRDLAKGVPLIDETWVAARFTGADQLSDEAKKALEVSDKLVGEVQDADIIVIGCPIYNFNIAASLKLWIDLIVRPGLTVGYDATGNAFGMLKDKKVIFVVTSAGVMPGSPYDYVSEYLKFVFGYMGVTDAEFVWGDRAMFRGEEVFEEVTKQIKAL